MANEGYIKPIIVTSVPGVLSLAEQMFSDIIWADSMVFEPFENSHELDFNYPSYFALRSGKGLEVLAGVTSGGACLEFDDNITGGIACNQYADMGSISFNKTDN